MNIVELRDICLSFPNVTEDIKWGEHLCFSVGGKMFIITSPDQVPVSASFKTSDELFEELTDVAGIIPAPYMARNKWIRVDDIALFSERDWKRYLKIAYEIIYLKLPAKTKALLENKIHVKKTTPKKKAVKKSKVKKR